jgi:hypothetical protein
VLFKRAEVRGVLTNDIGHQMKKGKSDLGGESMQLSDHRRFIDLELGDRTKMGRRVRRMARVRKEPGDRRNGHELVYLHYS